MLNERELDAYFDRLQLSKAARDYVLRTRESEPSRAVGRGGGTNVCTWSVSPKIGRTIQSESRSGEYAYKISCDHAKSVLENWDQIPPIPVLKSYANGNQYSGSYCGDYLTLYIDRVVVVENKPIKKIRNLLKSKHKDWIQINSGYRYLPAYNAFKELGLEHVIVASDQFSQIRIANLRLLLQARYSENLVTDSLRNAVDKQFSISSWMRFSDLAVNLKLGDLTPILQLIDQGDIQADLDNELLSQHESTWLAKSQEILDICKEIRNQSSIIGLEGFDSSSIDAIEAPPEKQAKRAIEILKLVDSGENNRSIRRWRANIREGSKKGISRLLAVLPKTMLSGNRTNRIYPSVLEFLKTFISTDFACGLRPTKKKSYAAYKFAAKIEHVDFPPVSRTTFDSYLLRDDLRKIASGRGGLRAANAASSPTDVEDRELRASLPFELGTMDHFLCDIVCRIVSSNGKVYTAQPWLTALVDVASGSVLAFWLSFRHPSRRACSIVLRNCLRIHGRLPQAIIVDHGSDFESTFFFAFLAHCIVDLLQRPKSHPRYGAEAERYYGQFKSEWLSLRPGNTVNYKESRAVSASHSPSKLAEMELEDLLRELNAYNEWKMASINGANLLSSNDFVKKSLLHYSCLGKRPVYNEAFVIASAVDAKPYKVDPRRGIHIDDLHYWAPELSDISGRKKTVDVRREPEDPYRIYALVNHKWVTCYATKERVFHTQDPVLKMAEAIKVLDAQEVIRAAKDEAEQVLIGEIHKQDEVFSKKKESKKPKMPLTENSENNPKVASKISNIFCNASIKPLKTNSW